MLKRLQIKFVCTIMVIVTVMLGVIFFTVLHFTRQNLEWESIRMMQSIGANPFRQGRPDAPAEGVRLPFFTLELGRDGELIAAGGGYYDLSDEAFLRELIDRAFSSPAPTGVIPEYGLRFCRVEARNGERLVFADISSEQRTIQNLVKTCLLIGAGSLLVFFFISLLLARWAVKPVDRAWRQQRQFVADASHELKTPLTVIMTNAELLQNPDDTPQARAQFSDSILVMSRQMRGLVEGLLELARVDNGAVKTVLRRVELSGLVAEAVLPFEPLFFEQGLCLTTDLEEGIAVRGSAAHLKQVVDILLDNAQKYCAAGGEVTVSLHRQGRHCLLSVANPGQPLSPEERKHIFERFYRGDKARSCDGSYGLGLSIAQSIVTDHHGKIWADSVNGQNTFSVQLSTLP